MRLSLAIFAFLVLGLSLVNAQTPDCEFQGLRETFYSDRFYTGRPLAVRLGRPFYSWGYNSPIPGVVSNNFFGVRWDGEIIFPEVGTYQFQVGSDDGFRLFYNTTAHCEWFAFRAFASTTCARQIVVTEAGLRVPFQIDYFDLENDARIEARWKTPSSGSTFVPIPLSAFVYNNCTIREPILTTQRHIDGSTEGIIRLSLTSAPLSNVTFKLTSPCYFFSDCLPVVTTTSWNVPLAVRVYENAASNQECCPITVTGVDGDFDYFQKTATTQVCKKTTRALAFSYGDPHFGTFDGVKYDFFGIGDYYFLRDRTGELAVQTRQERCAEASCNYAIAIRYKALTFYVHMTRGGVPSSSVVGEAEGVKISQDGNHFGMVTPSGAGFSVSVGLWARFYYLSVHASLPSTFYGQVNGLAGFYDGQRGNDFAFFNGTVAAGSQEFARAWKVGDAENLFLSASAVIPPVAGAVINPSYSTCEPPAIPEVVRNETGSPMKEIPPPNDPDYKPIEDCQVFNNPEKETAALAACSPPFNTSAALCCSDKLGVSADDFFRACLCDYNLVNGPDFMADSVGAFTEECRAAATRLNSAECDLCPSGCHGNGECVNGECECFEGFQGKECTEDLTTPPEIQELSPPKIPRDCPPPALTVFGSHLYGNSFTCHFGLISVSATKVGDFELSCQLPTSGLVGDSISVTITRDLDGAVSAAVTLERFTSCCSSPCLNGGSCVGAPDSPSFTCQCPNDFFPPLCLPCLLEMPSIVAAEGGVAAVTVKLSEQPAGDVVVELSTDCAQLSACVLVFTPENWNQAQNVAVTQFPTNPLATCEVKGKTGPTGSCSNRETSTLVQFPISIAAFGNSWGDPHILTYDGLKYDNFGVGDYVLTRDNLGEFVVQTRQGKCAAASCNHAVAIRFRSTVYYVTLNNGAGTITTSLQGSPAADGVIIKHEEPYLSFYTPTGVRATVRVGLWEERNIYYLAAGVALPGSYSGKVSGLLGNFNGKTDDEFTKSDGSLAPSAVPFHSSWRVPAGENLFLDHAAVIPAIFGAVAPPVFVTTSCSNHTDPEDKGPGLVDNSPPGSPLADDPVPEDDGPYPDCTVFEDPQLEDEAETTCAEAIKNPLGLCCGLAGLPVEEIYDSCVCDYNLAQGPDFVAGSAAALFEECARRAPHCNACPDNCHGHGTCLLGICQCAPGFAGPTCGQNLNQPPKLKTLSPNKLAQGCPATREITVHGEFFYSDSLSCVFTSGATVPAVKISSFQLKCVIPVGEFEADAITVTVKSGALTSSNSLKVELFLDCCKVTCQNGGLCQDVTGGFFCDCSGTNFIGEFCQTPGNCPAETENGASIPSTENGASDQFSCPIGTVLTVSKSCSQGQFGDISLSCEPIGATCQQETLDHAVWPKSYAGMNAFGICAEGYVGAPERICEKDGSWAAATSGVACQVKKCASKSESNANWPETDAFQQATGSCQGGFVGTPTRLCNPDGTFGPIQNPCLSPVTCPAVNFDNANFPVTNGGEAGTGVCKAGYSGTPRRTCQPDGNWGSVIASCVRNQCQGEVKDGITWPTVFAFERSYGTCSVGTGGKPYRECLADGTWGGVVGTCFACQGEFFGRATWPTTPGGENAVGLCEAGWGGNPRRSCTPEGVWTTHLDSFCQRIYCPQVSDGTHLFEVMESGTQAYGKCLKGTGRPWRKCNLDGTHGPIQKPCTV